MCWMFKWNATFAWRPAGLRVRPARLSPLHAPLVTGWQTHNNQMLKVDACSSENGCVKFTLGHARHRSFVPLRLFSPCWELNYRPVTRPTHRPPLRAAYKWAAVAPRCSAQPLRNVRTLRLLLAGTVGCASAFCFRCRCSTGGGACDPRERQLSREEHQVTLPPHRQAPQTRTGHSSGNSWGSEVPQGERLNFPVLKRIIDTTANIVLFDIKPVFFGLHKCVSTI